MLEVKNLSVTYNGNIKALKQVNLNVDKGELLAKIEKEMQSINKARLSLKLLCDTLFMSIYLGLVFIKLVWFELQRYIF